MIRLENWIDFIEGEAEPRMVSQLNLLVKHSIDDKIVVQNLKRLRQNLKKSDPALQIENRLKNLDFCNSFHKKIMSNLKEIENSNRDKRKSESMPTDAHQA